MSRRRASPWLHPSPPSVRPSRTGVLGALLRILLAVAILTGARFAWAAPDAGAVRRDAGADAAVEAGARPKPVGVPRDETTAEGATPTAPPSEGPLDAPRTDPASAAGAAPVASVAVPTSAVAVAVPAPVPVAAASAEPAPVASESAAASASAPAPSASAGPPPTPGTVRLKDRRVFVVHVPRSGVSPEDRAKRATKALEHVFEEQISEDDVRVEDDGAYAVVFVGKTPIVQLGPEDAEAAGDSSYSVHAASVASAVRSAIRSERIRSAIANTVFHASLVVFAGLVAFLVLRRSTTIGERMQRWLEEHPERIPAVRIGGVELVGAAGLRGATGVLLTVLVRVLQVSVLYVWFVFSLSLFEATHDLSTRTSGFVTRPIGALADRLGTALPLLAITFVTVVAVWAVIRFLGLFFGSVARRETWVAWLPPDIASAAGILARLAVIVLALVFAAPLVTGSDEGGLSRFGIAALAAVAFASVPILAGTAVGVVYVFGRRLRSGDYVQLGGHLGRVREVTLLDTRLEDGQGCEIRVPHLAALVLPARVVGRVPVTEVEVSVDPAAAQSRVRELLLATARERDPQAQVRLLRLDKAGAVYRVAAKLVPDGPDLAIAVADALAREGVALGLLQRESSP